MPGTHASSSLLRLVVLSKDGHILNSFPCRGCGYDLRMQTISSSCPECGKLVAETVNEILRKRRRRLERSRAIVRGLKRIAKSIAVLFVVAFVAYLLLNIREQHVTEISPDTLRMRSYSYYVWTPFNARIRLSGTSIEDSTSTPLQAYLVKQGFVNDAPDNKVRWFHGYGYSSHGRAGSGPMQILIGFSGVFDATNDDLVTWSENHPEMAAALWPVVIEFMNHQSSMGMYTIDELMGQVRGGVWVTLEDLLAEIERMRKNLETAPKDDFGSLLK